MTEHESHKPRYSVVTLFPALIAAFTNVGIVRRAIERGLVEIGTVNPRDFTPGGHGPVDDAPYGGGPGMVMTVPPLRAAIDAARGLAGGRATTVAYLSPQGRRIDQRVVGEIARVDHLVLVAGRYEGIDERIIERDVDVELSLGDFVMSGGEVAAMALIDALVRLVPGALGSEESVGSDSFSDGLLEYPQYTRPEIADGDAVPSILLGGNHAAIAAWRRRQALLRTQRKRPDLLRSATLTDADRRILADPDAEDVGD